MLEITSLGVEHLEEAASLVSRRYDTLCEVEPRLPQHLSETPRLLPLLRGILAGSRRGVAAKQGARLVGFLTGWQMDSFRGRRSIYSPEWASAARAEDSQYIYEEMYRRVAADWVGSGCLAHYVSLLPSDRGALAALHGLGFGMLAIDALRGLDALPEARADVDIRRAEMEDLDAVLALDEGLWEHMRSTPSFQPVERRGRSHFAKWLENPERVIWLAGWKGEPVAFMSLGPANEDVCTIIRDSGTTSIYSAYTRAGARCRGIATALLAHALRWARSAGYERCAVDWESMNLEGGRFWLRHFRPVCYSLLRRIDENAVGPP